MKPVYQTLFMERDNTGNCFAACIASILEMRIENVPAVKCYTPELTSWLESIGMKIKWLPLQYQPIQAFWICGGRSPRGAFNHVCVMWGESIVHDPHPSAAGLATREHTFYIYRNKPFEG